jgi:hypothetical protein
MVDLDDIFSWMDVDLGDDLEGKPWSLVSSSGFNFGVAKPRPKPKTGPRRRTPRRPRRAG